MKLPKWDYRFLEMARNISTFSKDPSTQVGAIITDVDNRVVSVGYNGFPKGEPDDERLYNREEKLKVIIHAEHNAIDYAHKGSWDLNGCTLYTYPFIPCSNCAQIVIGAGITRVVSFKTYNFRWLEDFKLSRGLFKEHGVTLQEYPEFYF